MKIIVLLLIVIVLISLRVQADDPPSAPNQPSQFSKPTWEGDEHDQPVFTSPPITNAPAITNLPGPHMPPLTNWPSTNLPPTTNPPPRQPPHG